MIKILMQNRVDAFESIGGDTIEMISLKKYLEKYGVQVNISCNIETEFKNKFKFIKKV